MSFCSFYIKEIIPETETITFKFKQFSPDETGTIFKFLAQNCFLNLDKDANLDSGITFWIDDQNGETLATLLLTKNVIWNVCTSQTRRRQGYAELLFSHLFKWWEKKIPENHCSCMLFKPIIAPLPCTKSLDL